MHEMLIILTDVRGVCLSVCPSVSHAVARAVYTSCCVHGVIQCCLRQIPFASCLNFPLYIAYVDYCKVSNYLHRKFIFFLCGFYVNYALLRHS